MGTAIRFTLIFAISYFASTFSNASEDVELKDPTLVAISVFAANTILKDAETYGIQNTSSLHKIMDAHIVPGSQPSPTQYMLTIELGNNCTNNEETCPGEKHICEVIVLDAPWNEKRILDEDKTKCADREPNSPPEFIDSSTIATSLVLEDAATKALAEKAVSQMGERRGGKHTLKHIGHARKVTVEETNSSLYYLTLYISTTNEDVINEACEVTMEEALSTSEQILQSLRCFTTGDNEGADKFGITRVPAEELTTSLIRHAVLASLAIIDAESVSAFQFKVIGYLLADSRVSVDSGTRDLDLKLGLVPTLCIKRPEEENEDESKSCTIDQERDPSVCSITLTQWPWVSDGYLFSDFDCEPTTYAAIAEELEAYADEDVASEEEGAEVEEVSSNAVQLASRRENVEESVEGVTEEEGILGAEEEVFVARSSPCLGCPSNIDVNSTEVKDLANFALSALENAANSDKIQSVVRIEKATSQVVSGSLYVLTIELVDTNCLRSENADRSKCQPNLTEGTRRMCTVGIWDQPWLNSKQIREPQCVSPSLTVVRRSIKDESDVKTGRSLTPISPDDEEAKDIAAFALNRLDSFDDNSKKRILVTVVEGTSSTEGRSKTFKMKIHVALADCPEGSSANNEACFASLSGNPQHYLCDIQVLVPMRDSRFVQRRLVNSRCFPIKPHETSETDKSKDFAGVDSTQHVPQRNIVTDEHDANDKTSPYIKSVADFVTKTISQRSNGNVLNLVRIIRADTQLVAGKKVTLDVEVGFTNCTKADGAGTHCQLENSQSNVICHVIVWDRAWLNDRRVTNMTCDSLSLSSTNQEDTISIASEMPAPVDSLGSSPSSIVGGHGQADTMSTEIEAYADFALAVIEEQSNASEKLKVAKILASSVQIFQGKNVRLSLEIASTNCKKDQASGDNCIVDESKDFQVCNIQIWDRAWLQEKQVTDLNCQPKRPKLSGRNPKSEDFDESPFVGYAPHTFRLGGDVKLPKKGPRVGGRNTQQNLPLLGAYSKVDPADVTIVEIANFATTVASSSFNANSSNSAPYTLAKIHSAKKQVVAGINYKLELEFTRHNESLFCRVIVLEQSWLSLRELTNMTCFPQGFPPSQRKAKNALGAYRPAAVHDTAVKDAATFAVSAMSEASPNAPFSLMKIKNAARQIESKQVNYKLTLLLLKDKATVICNAIVAEKSSSQLVSSSCRDSKKRRGLEGGYKPADVKDATIREMADFATLAISKSTNAGALSVVNITSAETQVVSGKNYKITLQAQGEAGVQTCSVVVYDQSWTKTRKLTSFTCEDLTKTRVSRQLQTRPRRPGPPRPPIRPNNSELSIQPPSHCVGGYCPIDKNEKAVKDMANFATFALSRSMNSVPLQFVQVLSAERQVVAGFNYRLGLEFSEPRGTVFCKVVVFDQAWTSTRELSQMQCELTPSAVQPSAMPGTKTEAAAETPQSTVEKVRDSTTTSLPGAYVSVNPLDDEVAQLATFATTLLSHARKGDDLTLVKVLSATKEVVAGSNYQLGLQLTSVGGINLRCDVVVYYNANARHLTYSSCAPLNRRKRSSDQMTGGVTPMDINSKKTKELSDFAVSAIAIRSNEPNAPSNVRVLKATKQVVAGMMYTLELELKFTDCQQNNKSCIRRQKCNVSIWEQPWLGKREVTKLTCSDLNTETASALQSSLPRRHLVGGITPADPSSEEIKAHAAFALTAIQARSNARNLLNIVHIRNAGTQTVSGKKIYLTIEVGQTKCPLSSNQSDRECPLDRSAERQLCKVEIWTQPWLNKRQITNLKCAVLGTTNKKCTSKTCKRSRRSTENVLNTHGHHHHHHHSKNLKKTRRLKHMTAFRSFAKEFNKVYKTWEEFEHRYKIYRANQEKIQLLNRYEMGTAVYGDTPFSDWSAAEYKAHLAGFRPMLRQSHARLPQAAIPKIDLPDEFDWRNHSVVTPVKDQGSCGSCWAFSVTGNVEGVYAVRNGELLSLSEQELVDCDKLDSGCNGGLPENAYKAIHELGGLETESDYPYNGHQNKCKFDANITRVQVTGGVEISTNETEMAQWLVQNGPISIGINANAMQYYRGGVSHPWKALCRAGGIDHGVLIVGYGVANYPKFNKTLPYWIVKNSWGTRWGEQGFYRVFRGDGTCGLNKMCTSATLD